MLVVPEEHKEKCNLFIRYLTKPQLCTRKSRPSLDVELVSKSNVITIIQNDMNAKVVHMWKKYVL